MTDLGLGFMLDGGETHSLMTSFIDWHQSPVSR
uniref:Uncharacterized protein n=1 Tax=Anguilla anguilla TaxID=7936 RepID=A0A0E9UCY9_ANGAN